jgi:hypothetical protein
MSKYDNGPVNEIYLREWAIPPAKAVLTELYRATNKFGSFADGRAGGDRGGVMAFEMIMWVLLCIAMVSALCVLWTWGSR